MAGFQMMINCLIKITFGQQGSRLKADYDVTWTKDSFFQNSSSQAKEKTARTPAVGGGQYRNEDPRRERYISQFTSDDSRRKRFKVRNQIINITNKTNFDAFEFLKSFHISISSWKTENNLYLSLGPNILLLWAGLGIFQCLKKSSLYICLIKKLGPNIQLELDLGLHCKVWPSRPGCHLMKFIIYVILRSVFIEWLQSIEWVPPFCWLREGMAPLQRSNIFLILNTNLHCLDHNCLWRSMHAMNDGTSFCWNAGIEIGEDWQLFSSLEFRTQEAWFLSVSTTKMWCSISF